MTSTADFASYVEEQAKKSVRLSFRKMFGEYAVYANGKVVAFICDNSLFLKPTPAGRALLDTVDEKPPYPGAKLYFVIDEALDNPQLLGELLIATERALPAAKPKSRPKHKSAPKAKFPPKAKSRKRARSAR